MQALAHSDLPHAFEGEHPPGILPSWLLAGLAERPEFITSAHQPYSLRAIDIDQPMLVIPLRGTKTFSAGQDEMVVEQGSYLMLHRTMQGTVQNIPDHDEYRAWCIAFPWRVIDLARSLLDAHTLRPVLGAGHSSGSLAALHPELQSLLTVLGAAEGAFDNGAYDHALLGLLLALNRNGDAQFRLAQDPSVAARIRLLVGARPDRDWVSADFEQSLHMSGATLRRRLAEENTSLRIVLRDARLHHGVALLQTTRRPLKAVALACGYRSVPSFTRQFVERFGVDPAAVAAAPVEPAISTSTTSRERTPALGLIVSSH
jgi:AraC-like DNA-binding protein